MWDTHTKKMEYDSVIKKNVILPFFMPWMDLEIAILSEVSQTEKDKCIPYMWESKKMVHCGGYMSMYGKINTVL